MVTFGLMLNAVWGQNVVYPFFEVLKVWGFNRFFTFSKVLKIDTLSSKSMFSVFKTFLFLIVDTIFLEEEEDLSVSFDILPAELCRCLVFDFRATLEWVVDFEPIPNVHDFPHFVDLGFPQAVDGWGLEISSPSS